MVRKLEYASSSRMLGRNDGAEESDLAQIPRMARGVPDHRIPFT